MSSPEFRIEPLRPDQDRTAFSCGVVSLDTYLHQQATQDTRTHVSAVFVLVRAADRQIAGYYTLSSLRIPTDDLPGDLVSRMPATLLGRLAVDLRFRGLGFGGFLLYDACERAWRTSLGIASMGLVVDPLDEEARSFYAKFGFANLPGTEGRMMIPMSALEKLIEYVKARQAASKRSAMEFMQ